MKFLVDMALSPKTAKVLRDSGLVYERQFYKYCEKVLVMRDENRRDKEKV
jgi:predicted nuclease of predicted toxin-antitoxin system